MIKEQKTQRNRLRVLQRFLWMHPTSDVLKISFHEDFLRGLKLLLIPVSLQETCELLHPFRVLLNDIF